MRRPVLLALIAVLAVLMGFTVALFVRYRKTAADYTDMRIKEELSRTGYAEAFRAIAEIQDSLNAIALGDTTVRVFSPELRGGQEPTEMRRREALGRIALLDASIQRSKERIRRLEAGLRKSGIELAGLEKMISGLKQQVSDKEAFIAQLTGRVDSLQTAVAGLKTEVQLGQEAIRARERAIEEKRRELAAIYYIVGTKKELLTSGVIVAKGGILGLGRILQPSDRFDESLFTALDTDRESVVRTQAPRLQVLSAQPAASYELKLVGGWMELHIRDPKEFRKIHHLVIMTK